MPYHVYVIELDPEVRKIRKFRDANPDMRPDGLCFYVGQSAHDPDCRYRQHKECWGDEITFSCICGVKRGRFDKRLSNRFARVYGMWLKRDLFEELNPIRTREDAEIMESRLANRLRFEGHGVWWG